MDSGEEDHRNEARSPQEASPSGEDSRAVEQAGDGNETDGLKAASGEAGQDSAEVESASSSEDQELLERALECFEQGNFAEARRIASRLASDSEDETIRAEAESLLERTAPDRVAVILGILCLVLILVLGAVYL